MPPTKRNAKAQLERTEKGRREVLGRGRKEGNYGIGLIMYD